MQLKANLFFGEDDLVGREREKEEVGLNLRLPSPICDILL
jgi:hypothetical protein